MAKPIVQESSTDPRWFVKACQRFTQRNLFLLEHEASAPNAISGATLLRSIEKSASLLLANAKPQQRVLLFLPHGFDYLHGLLGCLYANLVAVPVPLVEFSQAQANVGALASLAETAQVDFLLTNTIGMQMLRTLPQLAHLRALNIDVESTQGAKRSSAPVPTHDDIAVLLFTSGSTSQPKGIVLSHAQLLAQAHAGAKQWGIDDASRLVSWLPHYHNFGLHFGFLAPLLRGASSVLFSPQRFIERPELWLEAIDRHRATHTAAPNFAFDFVCTHVDTMQLRDISLRSLRAIVCGGETVRKPTYERFAKTFRSNGLKPQAFCPHYGLSETGAVTTRKPQMLRFLSLDSAALQHGKIQRARNSAVGNGVIDCGEPLVDVHIRIVDPNTARPLADNAIGEIWVRAPGVACGYWNQEAATAEQFSAAIVGRDKNRYLRTGDLGFLRDNRLYVVGRRKELIIVHGKNHYPIDIELSIQKHLPHMATPAVVLPCEFDGKEQAIVLQAVDIACNALDYAAVAKRVVEVVSELHGLELYDVCFVRAEDIPRTRSGKMQRIAIRDAYLRESLSFIYRHRRADAIAAMDAPTPRGATPSSILHKLQHDVLSPECDSQAVLAAESLGELGLNSIQYVRIAKRIEEHFGLSFAPTLLFKYRKLGRLADYIASRLGHVDRDAVPETVVVSRDSESATADCDIAVIGMSGHFPGAENLQVLWANLLAGKDSIVSVTSARQQILQAASSYTDESTPFPPWGGFVADIDAFDAAFFGIARVEAESMDPQQRKMLELIWETVESAGYNPRTLSQRRVALFVGAHNCDYTEVISQSPQSLQTYGAYLDSGLHMSMIANRASRWFDFRGRSELINSACSSSLVAVCHAFHSLVRGECELAVAAGINLILSPRVYLASHQAGMLAADGRCKTFDRDANGFVRAEGYGAVLLKPLRQALADHDSIYGVIKGAAINHDGHSNSLRAPNLESQKELIKAAYRESGVAPETITYIEAHGTGTALGDPIEVQALQEAFSELSRTQRVAFCGLGTIKSSIGHSESAAGMAGLLKVLLATRHGVLPGNLHFNRLNPYIRLDNGPFYIVHENRTWERLRDEQGCELPRRAGVSSFGFGGVNAHVIIEEYAEPQQDESRAIPIAADHPVLIVLSAKNEERLKEQASRLLSHLNNQAWKDADLGNLAYTLQVGREALEHRLAFTVTTLKELQEKLGQYIGGGEEIEDCYRGEVKRNKDALSVFDSDEDMVAHIEAWIAKGKYAKLLALWVKGWVFDWRELYTTTKPKRISLPTYPFAKERYWVPVNAALLGVQRATTTKLHPLVHINTSSLSALRFSSTFTGEEFFLADHRVYGRKILPGVASLEMAQVAVTQAMSDEVKSESLCIELRDIVWLQSIVVDDAPVTLNIGVYPDDSGGVKFEIYSSAHTATGLAESDETIVHSQGRAMILPVSEITVIDLQALQARCTRQKISAAECYESFSARGIEYGAAFQGINHVYAGNDEALAKLQLPQGVPTAEYGLHPSVLDSAVQASIGLSSAAERACDRASTPSLLFALDSLQVRQSCPGEVWVWVRRSESSGAANRKLDIDICNAQGEVCVRLRGLASRAMIGEGETKSAVALTQRSVADERPDDFVGELTLVPRWDVARLEDTHRAWPEATESVLLIGGTPAHRRALEQRYPHISVIEVTVSDDSELIAKNIERVGPLTHVFWMAPQTVNVSMLDDSLIIDQRTGVLGCFRVLKALLRLGYGRHSLGWTVITVQTQGVHRGDSIDPTHASVHGLIGSMAKEYPTWRIRLIDLARDGEWPLDDVLRIPADEQGNAWAYRSGEWFRQQLLPCTLPIGPAASYRHGGVYVVIGGAGGLGHVLTEYLIRRYQAHVVWIGRRALDASIQSKLKCCAALGPAPEYLQADATDRAALQSTYQVIKERHGEIHGLIHSAVAMSSSDLAHVDEARFTSSLAAKLEVSVRMAQVFARERLDFVLFFSSIQSFEKLARQSNYAAGCAFNDAYAERLSQEWSCPIKVMNWGYWKVGDLEISESFQNWLAQAGFGSIESAAGMVAVETLLSGPVSQQAFLRTTKPHALKFMSPLREQLTLAAHQLPRLSVPLARHPVSVVADILADNVANDAQASERQSDVERMMGRLLYTQLQSLGLFVAGQPSIAEWRQIHLSALYDRWIEESVRVLAGQGYITLENGVCTAKDRRIDAATVWAEWAEYKHAWLADPNLRARVTLVEATLGALPAILTGKQPATDILFPHSSIALVEGIYKHNPVSDYFNDVLALQVVEFIDARIQRDPSARIRILEIGAGTGGTSEVVLTRLTPYQAQLAEYRYTDLSKAFLLHAQERYAANHPYLTTAIFNVEQPLAEQSIEIGSFDLVIAANVLHATSDIRTTLRNAKAALKQNGVLLLNELVSNTLFAHLTFGLLEGWWKYEDRALRVTGCPALSADSWQRVLAEEGFYSIQLPASAAQVFGQQVILACSDGLIRQPYRTGIEVSRAVASKTRQPRAALVASGHSSAVTEQTALDHVKQIIREQLGASLKVAVETIDAAESFADYGLDSIMAVRTAEAINLCLSIKLTTTSLFDYPTANKLTAHILAEYRAIIVAGLGRVKANLAVGDQEERQQERISDDRSRSSRTAHNDALGALSAQHLRTRRALLFDVRAKTVSADSSAPANERVGALLREPIAIVGMSARYATSDNVHALWKELADGTELTAAVTRWDLTQAYAAAHIQNGCQRGGFLNGIDQFDPLFFNISGIEATYMDPQQRIFLEEAWQALEEAGYTGASIEGRRCGVYVGYNGTDYPQLFRGESPPAQAMWGGAASILSARIAYFLDLKGPAMTIDTACSSSLVAIHLACQGLRTGEIDLALAGGVAVQCTPEFYVMASRAGMLSPEGRCYTFDDRANGFVPGEGVGVVVLKRLSDALNEGDHLHAVIRGSGVNQDGATNGITAPSALSQEHLEREVYETFQIHPEDIQMVEAHGTGTKLGDPIEYQALSKAFRKDTDKEHFCAIGSIKTNIGHTTAASGVAGVIKCVLALKHKQIPPSLHFEKSNMHIDMEHSPFYVNTTLRNWDMEAGKKRCAAVSSFGMSGTNAHLVIEEAPITERAHAAQAGYLIVLSARNAEQLQAQVMCLVRYCSEGSSVDCGNISYTLLMGRQHFNHRLACVVQETTELVLLLTQWIAKGKSAQVYVSSVDEKGGRERVALTRYGNQCIDECCQGAQGSAYRENLSAVADLFIQGHRLDFERLFDNGGYSRLSLPTYPFAKERYWVESSRPSTAQSGVVGRLHPLLQRNTSSLSEQRFSSTFTSKEFYLNDHVVKNNKVLPGVCYLEMARAALAASLDNDPSTPIVIEFKNVVWLQPVVVTDAQEVHIALTSGDQGAIEFEIYTSVENATGKKEVVHAQGQALLLDAGSAAAAETVDLPLFRSQSDHAIEVTQCYAAFNAMGLKYGPAHRGLTRVQVGTDAQGQPFVLAQVNLPACVSETQDQYGLHPSVLDSALQAAIGFSLATDAPSEGVVKPSLPFALETLQILDRTPTVAMVLVRPRTSSGTPTENRIQKLDFDLCDESGRVCVRLRGFTSRVLETELSQPGGIQEESTLLLTPQWVATPLLTDALAIPFAYGERWVFVDALYKKSLLKLKAQSPGLQWAVLPGEGSTVERLIGAGELVFSHMQSLLQNKPKQAVLLQVLLGADAEHQSVASALSGLLKSASLENPKFVGQVLMLSRTATVAELASAVAENASAAAKSNTEIRYVDGVREITRFKELSQSVIATSSQPWKHGGVYLITGGGGGLGSIVAQEIVTQVNHAKIILTGRSPISAATQAAIQTLKALALQDRGNGAAGKETHIEYRVLDVSDAAAVTECVHSLVEQYGSLNGIVHGAGIIKDNFIVKKTSEEFRSVLAPKVAGTINLDRASQAIELDFLILFSSVAGVLGNVGQSDYALANAFMDRFAIQRNELVGQGKRHGKTLSINWALWSEGGMSVDAAVLEQMHRQGLGTLTATAGIDALYRAWTSHESQVLVLVGELQKLRSLVGLASKGGRSSSQVMVNDEPAPMAMRSVDTEATTVGIDTGSLLEKVQRALTQLIAQQLQVKAADVDVESELSEFGFDSISLVAFGNTLNRIYGLELSPTIFFEYPTVQRFADYLASEHTTLLATHFAVRTATAIGAKSASPLSINARTLPISTESFARRGRQSRRAVNPVADLASLESMAIIGMSGCFPGASNVDEYWENLKAGKDCITEIPKSRWDWQAVYGDPQSEVNKTNIKWGGFIEGVEEFDPLFFRISPKEAESMDPQQRLLMMYTWKAIEDAGYAASSLSGSQTGIFVGTASSGYSELLTQAQIAIEGYSSTGAVSSVGPNRMSYLLNLHGPSEPIETACSSSLVAIHRAVRAMQSGDCDQALVGGINTMITPWAHISFSKAGMLCEDGRCKTFSKDANGYVRGEGVGMLFLKKLSAAERDGDHIYALIAGSAENHGGRANSLTAPNPKAQAELLKAAYREAKIDPRTVSYIEAHGTGTPLGDPIEINGLTSAFAQLSSSGDESPLEAYCGLGSVKTNIGHLELAAGVAGVIKVLLQLKHKTLAPSLHCEQINPYIQLQGSPFYLVNELQPWAARKDVSGRSLPRRAGVSSFGFGGVNAHVIIEEYCAADQPESPVTAITPEHPALIVLSAKSEERLQEQAKQLLAYTTSHWHSESHLVDLAYTLQVGREPMEHRLALTATTINELHEKLAGYLEGKIERGEVDACYRGEVKKSKEALGLLAGDAEFGETIGKWIQHGKYTKLLELWVKGLSFDWSQLYGEGSTYAAMQPKRISLPTYPFAKERCWIRQSEISQPKKMESKLAPRQAPVALLDDSSWLKVAERWLASPLNIEEKAWPSIMRSKGAQRVLVLYRRSADVEMIRKALAQVWAESANKLLVDVVQLPKLSVAAEVRALDDYLVKHRYPDAVFYFSGDIEDSSHIGRELQCVLQASQALMGRAGGKAVQFYYCYPATETVTVLYQEGLSGLFRAIALECPTHCYRSIEYPQSASLQDYVLMVREWLQHSVTDPIPAQLPMARYREGTRYVTALLELADSEAVEKPPQFRRGATYLMAGGLGEVGQTVCHALARLYRPRLVILSRRPLDADIQQRLTRITEAGAEVIYRAVDITDESQLAETFGGIKETVGTIDGVFHFARTVSDGPLQSKSFASFQQTIAAKVKGTLTIDKVTAGEPLDFFIVYSSMASFGIEGSADYGYATAFQNAFVRDRNRRVERGDRVGRSLALCWGQWAVDGYSNEQRDARLRQLGFDFIDAVSAVPLMEASLQECNEVIGVMAVTNKQRVKQLYGLSEAIGAPIFRADSNTASASLLKNLLELDLVDNGDFEVVARRVLLEQSDDELAEIYAAIMI